MAHLTTCAPVDMPPANSTTLDTAMGSPPKYAEVNDPLTWQQQEDFSSGKLAKRRGRKYKARGRGSPHHHTQAASPTSAPQPHDHNTKKPRANKKKKKIRGEREPAAMTAQASGSTMTAVPPHLRVAAQHPAPSIPPHLLTTAQPSIPSIPPHLRKGTTPPTPSVQQTPPTSTESRAAQPVQSSTHSDKVVAEGGAPPTPARTAEKLSGSSKPFKGRGKSGSRKGRGKPESIKGWGKPDPTWSSPQWDNQRWSAPPRGKHVWLKSRDIPKRLSTHSSDSDGGAPCRSDSDGDPTYDVKKLMAWNGTWLPPPEEWAARKGYTARHFEDVIEKWADGISRNCTNVMSINTPEFAGIKQADGKCLNKDLVPRYWLHDSVDDTALRKFWHEFPQRAPAPLSNIDITIDPPYWDRWEDKHPGHCFMTALANPDAFIDLDNAENELHHPFAMMSTEDRLARLDEQKKIAKRRQEERRNRPVAAPVYEAPQVPDMRLKPKANMYIRPVQPADVGGIMTIYNYYVKNTIHAPELEERTKSQISTWIDEIVQEGLPCLVAVAKRSQRYQRNQQKGFVEETIVGFTHLEEHAGRSSLYRFTFELALYIHPGYVRQGVGQCLLDQLMHISHPGYNKKGGYEYVNNFQYLRSGKTRLVKTILMDLRYYERGNEDIEWATGYLGEYGFKKAGHFTLIGHKFGKVIDKVVFQAHTSEVIDPKSIPVLESEM
ncbi:hypothetical protein C7974DRAFT_408362 [Boeremia exigua]|uniref:uncharacterized protein n=1 Tax=Boeremia exigua TaxID=749465 RepID=UPI001E8CFEC0|nr:uncharacterized protein C7974DRAFT_408362 [Boeremia exigua]KAH6644701.1 hypothetical protein C7974DRAFT_408362 [Boeremia exigua]